MDNREIQVKEITPILVALIEGAGKISDANVDIDKLYEYIYQNKLHEQIVGPTIGIFYTERGGKYQVAVPLKSPIPESSLVHVQTLPSIKCMAIIHKDGVETIEESFDALKAYQKLHRLPWIFPVREVYHPSEDSDGRYTIEIQVPIEIRVKKSE